MSNGAGSIHKQLRTELENYIKSQYFGKTPVLLSEIEKHIDDEGLLYQKPYIESSPAYKSVYRGIEHSNIPEWLKLFFGELSDYGLGVYPSPFTHQIKALESAVEGKDLFVSTGTGSGKTECFMWPLLAKMLIEARTNKSSWKQRGVRAVIMYPMNALVSDQVSRLRRLIGDKDGNYLKSFRKSCQYEARRPQFGMYTGRTPYPGLEPNKKQDKELADTLSSMMFPDDKDEQDYYNLLQSEGKIPAKNDMESFIEGLVNSRHVPDPEDAELITRFEMQQFCPDILITNYSMLEYMLLRPREKKIWDSTIEWLNIDENNKLLFIIDEAHMYRGSSGGEVALLIRRLLYKLGISRDRVQFILTTASMPNKDENDRNKVLDFARKLTASDDDKDFVYLRGEKESIDGLEKYNIPFEKFLEAQPSDIEESSDLKIDALIRFWRDIDGYDNSINNFEDLSDWMYNNLVCYKQFHVLMEKCRGTAVSLDELAKEIFPNAENNDAIHAVSVLLAIAPLAKNKKGSVLFPARMHMLFRGITGVYACTNEECEFSCEEKGIRLGKVFFSDGKLVCPHCNSMVYELYNDRRCGALFYKGYVLADDINKSKHSYLWRYPGQVLDINMKEVHLYIPPKDFNVGEQKGVNKIRPCYLDVHSGFVNFKDDSLDGKAGIRKLYYCDYSTETRPEIVTFPTCPHCRHLLSHAQLTSFSTRGNLSFFSLIQSQFNLQPAVPGKVDNPEKLPNEGRKVLLFSDSRQRAAKLARDMSYASDIAAARQLFVLAIDEMQKSGKDYSLNEIYDYFCLMAGKNHVRLFNRSEREKFTEDSDSAFKRYQKSLERKRPFEPRNTMNNAQAPMQGYLLSLFCGGYNTLYDSASSWLEPKEDILFDAVDLLEESGIHVTEEEFIEFFNAWMLFVCDRYTALGHSIPDYVRLEVRNKLSGYGLDKDWKIPKHILTIMGWKENDDVVATYKRILKELFLDVGQSNNEKLYIDLTRVKPKFDLNHTWFRCEVCSEITPYRLKKRCPSCGADKIHPMTDEEYRSIDFWRRPIIDAIDGCKISVIDTEEHTAQLSHKDQRDELWSKTEQYELRFQDFVHKKETPVDILSSTTTMEVGIDIGSLVAVGLRNIPPMRENYQQRAGRAGRRGSSLSTIVTFCEDGPHDTMYFNDPVPMFRGDPRTPWIDIESEKLVQRHIGMIVLQSYLQYKHTSLDQMPTYSFVDELYDDCKEYIEKFDYDHIGILLPDNYDFDVLSFKKSLYDALNDLRDKVKKHPELYGVLDDNLIEDPKDLLEALYEEGTIPTYSFPKNVVSTYITNSYGKVKYQVERGLDVAISEYAPGRSIVVDKETYQVGGFFYPGSEKKKEKLTSPASSYLEDPNYLKNIKRCSECGWFGLETESSGVCPFCGNKGLSYDRRMLKPWGFAPLNGRRIADAQLDEQYSSAQQPVYSTLPDSDDISDLKGCKNIRIASRTNQRIIMLNNGSSNKGFMVCSDCGAAMPGDDEKVLEKIGRPYLIKYEKSKCKHTNPINVNLGYDFVTDMLVLEFVLDPNLISVKRDSMWINRAAQSLAEAIKLAISKQLDVEYTELVTGFRCRSTESGFSIDIYIYDSLSSGAGYAVGVADKINDILSDVKNMLQSCDCHSACHKCLKHQRNMIFHGILDRFAALDLLRWGVTGELADSIAISHQQELVRPLNGILSQYGFDVEYDSSGIAITKDGRRKILEIYPSMWIEPKDKKKIYISDAYIKFAKPYAVKKIIDSL